MKALLTTLIFSIFTIILFAQPPQGINYQAIYRNASGDPSSQSLSVEFDIYANISGTGTPLFSETHSTVSAPQTGLFNLKIGANNPTAFAAINWASGSKFLKVTINGVAGPVTEMLSVPFALYAANTASNYWNANGNKIYASSNNYSFGIGVTDPSWSKLNVNNSSQNWLSEGIRGVSSGGTGVVGIGGNGTPGQGTGIYASGDDLGIHALGYNKGIWSIANGDPAVQIPVGVHGVADEGEGVKGEAVYGTGLVGLGKIGIDANGTEKAAILRGNSEIQGRLDFIRYKGFDPVTVQRMSYTSDNSGMHLTYDINGNRLSMTSTTSSSPSHGWFGIYQAGTVKARMYVDSNGKGVISGDIKNFSMPHPSQPGKEIWYASVEGPEAAAYSRGTASLVNGEATITFTDDFQIVSNPSTMTVILTPCSASSKGLAVVEKTTTGFVVKELLSGSGNYNFDWEVKCVRKGYEDYKVIRDKRDSEPALEFRTDN